MHRAAAVAGRGIELALRGDHFTASDIMRYVDDPPSRSTVYRVLRQLEQDDWIEQTGNGWDSGIKTQMLSGVDSGDGSSFDISAGDVL